MRWPSYNTQTDMTKFRSNIDTTADTNGFLSILYWVDDNVLDLTTRKDYRGISCSVLFYS